MSLAIECGATNSVAVYVQDEQEEIEFEQVKKYHFGPANFKLLKLNELEKYFQNVYDIVEEKDISALAIAMPGVLNETDRKVSNYCCYDSTLYNTLLFLDFEEYSEQDLDKIESNLDWQ